jgi:hypothetical protein
MCAWFQSTIASLVPRINHSFSLSDAPEQAQAWFIREIAPELQRIGGFGLDKEKPGLLLFTDRPADPVAFSGGDGMDYSLLSSVFPRRIHVDFAQDVSGTRIAVRGTVGRDMRESVGNLLPRAKYWSEDEEDRETWRDSHRLGAHPGLRGGG